MTVSGDLERGRGGEREYANQGWTERQTDRQTNRHTDKEADRQRDRQWLSEGPTCKRSPPLELSCVM